MTQENTQTGPDAVETDQDTTKGFEGMAEKMEQCGCCGSMTEKMKGFMQTMCGTADDDGEKAETDGETKTEDKTGAKAGCG